MRVVAVVVLAVSCLATTAACSAGDEPVVGVTGLEYERVTLDDLLAAAKWCDSSPYCRDLTQDDAVYALEVAAHIMCEPSELAEGLPYRAPDEMHDLLVMFEKTLRSSNAAPAFVIGVTEAVCPEVFPLAVEMVKRLGSS